METDRSILQWSVSRFRPKLLQRWGEKSDEVFHCCCWLSQAFLIKARVCTVHAYVCVCVGWWGAACGGTVNMPVCLYTMCLCESWLCVGEKDMAVTRERDRERVRQRGVVWGFSFSAISFPSVCPSLCSILTSIVLPFLFQRSFY